MASFFPFAGITVTKPVPHQKTEVTKKLFGIWAWLYSWGAHIQNHMVFSQSCNSSIPIF